MPESKYKAMRRSKRLGIPAANVTKSPGKGYFIAPSGVRTKAAKKAYAALRSTGKAKATAAKIAGAIEKRRKR